MAQQTQHAPRKSAGPVSYALHLCDQDATECDVCRERMTHINYYSAVRPPDVRAPMSMLICDTCRDRLRAKPDFGYGGIDQWHP